MRQAHYVAIFFSMVAFVLLIFANFGIVGTNSPTLQKVFIVQGIQTKTNQCIRYGFFRSCIFEKDSVKSCTAPQVNYFLDTDQLAALNSIDVNAKSKVKQVIKQYINEPLKVRKVMSLVLPAVIMSLLGMIAGILLVKMKGNSALAIVGALASLIGTVCGAVALGFGVAIYRDVFEELDRAIDGLMYYWGPAVYIVGSACGCQLIAFVFFIAACFAQRQSHHIYEHYERHSFTEDDNRRDYCRDHRRY